MSREHSAVVLAVFSIFAIIASTLAMDWFIATLDGAVDVATISFDLREARACSLAGVCGVVPMSMIKGGLYPGAATLAFWGSLAFAALVLYQCGSRLVGGFANEALSKAGYTVGTFVILAAVGAGYLFGPDVGDEQVMGFGIAIERSWGPSTMLLGVLLGFLALYYTREGSINDMSYAPVEPVLPVATARTKSTTMPPPRAKDPTAPPPIARTKTTTTPPPKKPSAQLAPIPYGFSGKLQYAMVTGEITAGGIDARREDGRSVLVMWRDVVGLVVRRLPPTLEGYPFVDIVSTAGMTLRVLPWSKLTGEPIGGDAPDARVRAFVAHVVPRCPEAKIDRATQAFLDGAKPAAQLSVELLAKHDQALA